MATKDELAQSFGAVAGAYESGRPGYPSAAVAWMLEPVWAGGAPPPRVADVGAGTGKLTRALTVLGAEVVAIEPDPDMLAALHEAVPGVPTFAGSAELLPLPDAGLDAVVLGQAWHWVDPVAGSAEAGRVLRSGGVLGLVWNFRDADVPWVAKMTDIMHGSVAETLLADGAVPVEAPFGAVECREWRWVRPMTRTTLFDMARSRSYIITAEASERARIEAELAALFDQVGAIGDATIELPYVTQAFRSVRP
jgi:SAM-dependent methyltransferase